MTIRKALMVGINAYPGAPLRGCINDVTQMRGLLMAYSGFQEADFTTLLDTDATHDGIKAGLVWLAEGGNDTDAVRVFHYSGHGSYVPDTNGDEPDGRDECLVPVDYKTAGMLTDDELKELYDRFPRAGNLTLVMDSCHSGSVQKDLAEDVFFRFLPVSGEVFRQCDEAAARFREQQQEFMFAEISRLRDADLTDDDLRNKVRSLMTKFEKARFGDVRVREGNILLAGCRADQTSADARIAGDYHGAFTYYMAGAITAAGGALSYHDLAAATGAQLAANNFFQVPQLEYRSRRDRKHAFAPFI